MQKTWILAISVLIVLPLLTVFVAFNMAGVRSTADAPLTELSVPHGVTIGIFTESLGGSKTAYPGPNGGPRMMAWYKDSLIVSLTRQGKVIALTDFDLDGIADRSVDVIQDLNNPHGLAVIDDVLYIAAENEVIYGELNEQLRLEEPELLVELPDGQGHFTRTLLYHNDSLLISIGSSCNVCDEDDPWRATIIQCSLEGECELYARGVRNSVGLTSYQGDVWATDNGRDLLGDDLPPEEVNKIERGEDYGWPLCYGDKIHDTQFDSKQYITDPCETTIAPEYTLPAHTAPLGLMFYEGDMFPQYQGDLFVALHGSWNRGESVGYKVVRIHNGETTDFFTGFFKDNVVRGRPVGLIEGRDGSILVSEDNKGVIYRLHN